MHRAYAGTNNDSIPLSLYPDYTVGPGITPGLLTLPAWSKDHAGKRSRARHACHYRRWGIAPRPENVA